MRHFQVKTFWTSSILALNGSYISIAILFAGFIPCLCFSDDVELGPLHPQRSVYKISSFFVPLSLMSAISDL